jgi:uncharacterized protein YjbI with pentapeptide repeats
VAKVKITLEFTEEENNALVKLFDHADFTGADLSPADITGANFPARPLNSFLFNRFS